MSPLKMAFLIVALLLKAVAVLAPVDEPTATKISRVGDAFFFASFLVP